METSFRPHLFGVVAGLFLALALVLASIIFAHAWLKISEAQTISVTGSARKTVRSDLVVWRGSVLTEAATLLAAQQALKADVLKAEGFLRANAVTNYLISPISIEEVRARQKSDREDTPLKTVGFRLSQVAQITLFGPPASVNSEQRKPSFSMYHSEPLETSGTRRLK